MATSKQKNAVKRSSSKRSPRRDPVFDAAPILAPSRWPRAGPTGGPFEYKNLDTTVSATFSTTSSSQLLNGSVLGTSASTRVGRKIQIRRIDLVLDVAPSTTTVNEHAAFMLVVDHQPNGGTFNVTDYLTTATSLSLPNPNEFQRFTTVARYDLTIVGNASSGPASLFPTCIEQIPCNIPTFYNAGNAGSIADIQSNAFYLFEVGNGAAGATNPTFSGQVRLWYTDA